MGVVVSWVKRLVVLLAMAAIIVGASFLAWWIADDPDEAQVTSSVAIGVAIVIVTWIYTRHTRDMAVEMRDESRRARLAEQALHVGAIENMITELVELSSFIDSQLRANDDNTGTKPPYPQLHLLTIDSYFAVASKFPSECTAAVLRCHYQLEAANVRSTSTGFWKRADPLVKTLIPGALVHLRDDAIRSAAHRTSCEGRTPDRPEHASPVRSSEEL